MLSLKIQFKEVFFPDDDMSRYMSSIGGGQLLEEDELDFYDGYEA